MKKILKYFMIFVVSVFILTSILTLTAKIPKQAISENIRRSNSAFHTKNEIDRVVSRRDYTYTHPYSDAMILNIIYCIDTDKPLQSVMEAKYFAKEGTQYIDYDFENLVKNDEQGNTQYLRYWHGSMSIVRPLLVFFDLNQIYILNAIVLGILTIAVIVVLIKTKVKELVITFIIGLIMCAVITIPTCLMYSWTYLIMLIVSMIAIKLYQKGKSTNILFFITGIITCYFDFLCTELLSILVPILLILVLKYKDNKITNFKDGFKYICISLFLWGIAYIGMWFAKWILASIILNINAMDYVLEDAFVRINNDERLNDVKNLYLETIWRNIHTLYPINIEKRVQKLWIIPVILILFEMIFIKKQNIKKFWFSGLLIVFALVPYIRYLVLVSHSYAHYFFTFRMQMASIMAIILAMLYSTDIKKYEKKDRRNTEDEKELEIKKK